MCNQIILDIKMFTHFLCDIYIQYDIVTSQNYSGVGELRKLPFYRQSSEFLGILNDFWLYTIVCATD